MTDQPPWEYFQVKHQMILLSILRQKRDSGYLETNWSRNGNFFSNQKFSTARITRTSGDVGALQGVVQSVVSGDTETKETKRRGIFFSMFFLKEKKMQKDLHELCLLWTALSVSNEDTMLMLSDQTKYCFLKNSIAWLCKSRPRFNENLFYFIGYYFPPRRVLRRLAQYFLGNYPLTTTQFEE